METLKLTEEVSRKLRYFLMTLLVFELVEAGVFLYITEGFLPSHRDFRSYTEVVNNMLLKGLKLS